MSETPKTITVTIEQLVAFADHAQNNYDQCGGCNDKTDEELVAEFFGVEVPPRPAPPPRATGHNSFTTEETKLFTQMINGFTDQMALAQLVKPAPPKRQPLKVLRVFWD